jgi:hypothetical protein
MKAALEAEDSDVEVILKDIFNHTTRVAREMRAGNKPNQACINKLSMLKEKGELIFEYAVNSTIQRLEKMFVVDSWYIAFY